MDVVIAAAFGYKRKYHVRFIESLFETGYTGELVLFIRKDDVKYIHNNVHYIEVDTPPICDYVYVKYVVTRKFVENSQGLGKIFLVDFRDVLFQKNPSLYKLDEDLYFVEEGPDILACTCNTNWIKRIDESSFESMKNKKILCSGTIIGNRDGILRVCDLIIPCLEYAMTTWGIDPRSTMDQAYLNYKFYKGEITGHILTNDDNIVNTVGHAFKNVIDGKIINERGEVSCIVHQFDRFKDSLIKDIWKGPVGSWDWS